MTEPYDLYSEQELGKRLDALIDARADAEAPRSAHSDYIRRPEPSDTFEGVASLADYHRRLHNWQRRQDADHVQGLNIERRVEATEESVRAILPQGRSVTHIYGGP